MYSKTTMFLLCAALAILVASAATADCNDLVVEIDPSSAWRFVRPGDDDCTHGDVERFQERRIVLSGGTLAGPQCDLTLRGQAGTRSVLEVDQNLCVAEGGAIKVRHRSGPEIPFLAREGSAGNGRAGLITLGISSDPEDPGQPSGREGEIHLVTYNVFDRPYAVIQDGQDARMQRLPATLRKLKGGTIDAVVFQEAFNGDVLRDGLRRIGIRHQTPTITDPTLASLQNGGVFIASRWPITHRDSKVYRGACNGSDCLAAKGVVYARIRKEGRGGAIVFHVFGTHMQSGDSVESIDNRLEQARQLREFIREQNIPASEPVLIAGDFNEDAAHHPGQVRRLAEAMGAELPSIPKGVYSSDPTTNALVGLDGAAKDGGCCESYVGGQNKMCACCPREFLDLVLYSKAHRAPQQNLVLFMSPVTVGTFEACVLPYKCDSMFDSCRTWQLRDISDHYPVSATYRF